MTVDMIFSPWEWKVAPEYFERQMALGPALFEADVAPDSLVMAATPLRAVREMFDSEELQYCLLRFVVSAAFDISDQALGANVIIAGGTLQTIGYARGGTHQIAHAAHQCLVQMG